jgi:hypothetical protein
VGAWIALAGCSAYDPGLLDDAGPAPVAGSFGGGGGTVPDMDAGTDPRDAATSDAGRPDAGDAATTDTGEFPPSDAAEDGSASPDAGCGEGEGEVDCCPDDPDKTAPGACGCGVDDADGDGDGTPDCEDECPADPDKISAGVCGCGRPDSDPEGVSCTQLRDALVHRYRFAGSGTAVVDSAGDADGMLVNTQLTGTGQLDLAGGTSDQYADLPNGLVSALSDATFEVWVTWAGGNAWQRIFDFGSSDASVEGDQGNGRTYLFLAPSTSSGGGLRVAFSVSGSGGETRVSASAPLPSGSLHHVAVVIDDTNDRMSLYLDGAQVGSVAFTSALSSLNDINNWLGRSQYAADPELEGSLHEFRIYGAALSADQIAFSFADGPDPAYLEP